MTAKRIISLWLSLIIFSMAFSFSSCKPAGATCAAYGQNKTSKLKKNKSGYGTRYSHKTKPVGKSYMIRNGRQ